MQEVATFTDYCVVLKCSTNADGKGELVLEKSSDDTCTCSTNTKTKPKRKPKGKAKKCSLFNGRKYKRGQVAAELGCISLRCEQSKGKASVMKIYAPDTCDCGEHN